MDNIPWHIGLVIVAGLLVLNGLFVAAEFALVTVRRTRIRTLAAEGSVPARRTLDALGNVDYYVAASQLGITMASIALGYVGEPVLARLIEPPVESIVGSFAPAVSHGVAIGVAFAFVTGLHIVLGEFLPKTIALQQPERTALSISLPLNTFVRAFGPVIWLLNEIGNRFLRLVGMDPRPIGDQPLAAEDLALVMESSATAGLISRQEFDLARRSLNLSSLQVQALMIPRSDIIGISIDADRNAVLRTMAEHRHTRYLVYRSSLDELVGIIDAKAVLLDTTPAEDWRTHIRPPVLVPETARLAAAIDRIRASHSELAVAIDEYGGTAGLLSLADVARYLDVSMNGDGETVTERAAGIQSNQEDNLPGRLHLAELEALLGLELGVDDIQTAGGYVFSRLGRVPRVGDTVSLQDGRALEVVAMNGNRIERLRIIPPVSDAERDAQPLAGGQ